MRNSEEGKVGWIFTLGLGRPNPDFIVVVFPARVHLTNLLQ